MSFQSGCPRAVAGDVGMRGDPAIAPFGGAVQQSFRDEHSAAIPRHLQGVGPLRAKAGCTSCLQPNAELWRHRLINDLFNATDHRAWDRFLPVRFVRTSAVEDVLDNRGCPACEC